MSVTYEVVTGGEVNVALTANGQAQQPLLETKVELPDAYPGNVTISGGLSPVSSTGGLAPYVPIPSTPVTIALPAVPGGGLSLNYVLQINLTTGAVTMKTGTAATTGTQATPTADAGNLVFFTATVTNGDTIPYMRAPTLTDLKA